MAKYTTKTGFIFKGEYHKPGSEVTINKADKVDTGTLIEKGYLAEAGAEQEEQKDGGSGE